MSDLSPLFDPASIAIIGASPDAGRIRGKMLHLLKLGGYAGEIFPVNPSHREIQGLKAYAAIGEVPRQVDLATIAVPAEQVAATLRDCAAAKVKSAIVFTAGAAQGGLSLREQAAAIAASSGMRIMGPNTLGYVSPANAVNASFSANLDGSRPDLPAAAPPVAIVSQSGAMAFQLRVRAVEAGLALDLVAATGDESDVDCLDAVEYLLDRGRARAILMFVEGFRRAHRFQGIAARAADAGVPLIVMKIGSSEAGQRAAVSHTAHLTGADTSYDAIFERYGVTRVRDPDEMIAAAVGFSLGKLPRGRRIGIVSSSGGAGGWAADICTSHRLEVPPFTGALRDRLAAIIPAFGSPDNPADVTAQMGDDIGIYLGVLKEVLTTDSVDMVLTLRTLVRPGTIAEVEPVLRPLFEQSEKPILHCTIAAPTRDNVAALQAMGSHALGLRQCAFAFAAMARYGAFQQRWRARVVEEKSSPPQPSSKSEMDLLTAYGIPLAPYRLVASAEGAVSAAEELGMPVVLKVQSADIPHKTEAKALALGLSTKDSVRAAHGEILENALRYKPDARIDGVLVQKMMPPGREMVIGMVDDTDFGPLLMLGFGGIYIEVLRDVVFAPVPLALDDARDMIGRLKGVDILRGVRGEAPADLEGLARLLVSVSRLVGDADGSIAELDFNPMLLYPDGLCVVDALLVPRQATTEREPE